HGTYNRGLSSHNVHTNGDCPATTGVLRGPFMDLERLGAPPIMLANLELPDNDRPVYQRLADAIGQRIASGELAEGDKLPPHREIARALGINVTTVTRAFSALQQQGLVEARPGRGTRIACRDTEEGGFKSAPSDEAGLIDLSINRPPTTAYRDALTIL